jgi:hypothetical protein
MDAHEADTKADQGLQLQKNTKRWTILLLQEKMMNYFFKLNILVHVEKRDMLKIS